jgi:hypothetical protein
VDPEYYQDLLRPVFDGKKVIVCADALVGAFAVSKSLLGLGIERPFLIAGTEGTGVQPTPDEAECAVLGTSADSVMGGIRAFEAAVTDLPAEVLERIDAYDPDREALVVGTIFMNDEGSFLGRRTFGGRPREWERLEDKMVVDEILDTAGIARAPSAIVPATDEAALRDAAGVLDRGEGTAWAGDAREGWWGGGEYLRWVRSEPDAADAIAFFGAHCDRVRIMPFLDGVPCSIHGMVFDEAEIAFRPVEMLTLRRPETNKLHYAGLATYWDPPDADREEMRDAARKLGALLRARVGYRGVFTLDGVMTVDGFRPTEINPRAGAGIGPQAIAAGINIALLGRLARERPASDFRPEELEAHVVESADSKRAGRCYTVFPEARTETEIHPVVTEGNTFRVDEGASSPDGWVTLGPSSVGGFVSFQPDVAKTPTGPSFAPTAVRAFAFTDAEFGTGLGELEAANEVR